MTRAELTKVHMAEKKRANTIAGNASVTLLDGLVVGQFEMSNIPLLCEGGWTRHQQDIAKPPCNGADGVVRPAKTLHSAKLTRG